MFVGRRSLNAFLIASLLFSTCFSNAAQAGKENFDPVYRAALAQQQAEAARRAALQAQEQAEVAAQNSKPPAEGGGGGGGEEQPSRTKP